MSCKCKDNEYKEKFIKYLELMGVNSPEKLIERDMESVEHIAKITANGTRFLRAFYDSLGGSQELLNAAMFEGISEREVQKFSFKDNLNNNKN